jgi:hypothetical protein
MQRLQTVDPMKPISDILSIDTKLGLAEVATFLVLGWLALKLLVKFENHFPKAAEDFSVFLFGLPLSFVIFGVFLVRYFVRHHDWQEIRDGFAGVWLALSVGFASVVARAYDETYPTLTFILIIGVFVLFTLAFWQIFGM